MGKFTKAFKPSVAFGTGVGTGAVIKKTVPEEDQLSVYLGLAGSGMAAKEAAKNKRIQKLLAKKLGKKAAKIPLRGLLGPAGLGLFAKDIYDIGGPAISPAMAKEIGKQVGHPNLTPKEYRELLGGLTSGLKPSEAAKARKQKRKKTKERIQKGQIPKKLKGGFRASRKDILKSVGRKKGGRVGKPKGVGVAIKGFGKAMKNG
tara:strand:+ start:480 stop:1088 length:609 start_codon:yes stop_codon:yes gene_type:complete